MREIVVFDFDGTLTKKDSFLEFIKFSKGRLLFYAGLVVCFPFLVAYLVGLVSNSYAKEKLFSFYFKGMDYDVFCHYGDDFVHIIDTFLNKEVLREFLWRCKSGSTVYIISASIEEWVRPWGGQFGITDVIGTLVEISEDGKLTGHFRSNNCFGEEKVRRLLEVEPNRDEYRLVVYGDSDGDKDLMFFSDQFFRIRKGMWHETKSL